MCTLWPAGSVTVYDYTDKLVTKGNSFEWRDRGQDGSRGLVNGKG